ncbi:MAG TPA: hypothetical protein VFN10_23845 [Thermoanaerobaculia bacterium]|nr:hypothetical protein [Thermoanaerobaculia bacterium]
MADVSSRGAANLVAADKDWVPLYTGEPSIVAAIQAALDRRSIPSKLEQPMLGARAETLRRPPTLLVMSRNVPAARELMRDLRLEPNRDADGARISRSDATRLMCATAAIGGSFRRRAMLAHWRRKGGAIAPEVGVDIELVAQVCAAAEQRELGYEILFVALLIALPLVMRVPYAIPAVGVLMVAAFFGKRYAERWKLAQPFTREAWDPENVRREFGADITRDIREGLSSADQNLMVYRGFTPFVGAGMTVNGWTMLVDTTKAAQSFGTIEKTEPVAIPELYDKALSALKALHVPGCEIHDAVFVSGVEIRNNREMLPNVFGRPAQRVSQTTIERLRADNSDAHARWYPWVRVYDWENDIALSVFLRFHLQGKHLFIEVSRHLLTPLGEAYRAVDRTPPATIAEVVKLFITSAIGAPFAAIYYPLQLLARGQQTLVHLFGFERREHARAVRENPRFNFGVAQSLREQASSGLYSHYFQKIDAGMFASMLDAEILDTLVTYLDARGIDTSELRERRLTIVNSGIIVQSGDVKAGSLAVGEGARATMHKLTQRIRPAASHKGASA